MTYEQRLTMLQYEQMKGLWLRYMNTGDCGFDLLGTNVREVFPPRGC